MQTLRNIMTDQIKAYFGLDWAFSPVKPKNHKRDELLSVSTQNLTNYLAFLAEKDDESFLETYTQVREAINSLD